MSAAIFPVLVSLFSFSRSGQQVRRSRWFLAVLCALLVAGCSVGGGPNPPPPLDCDAGSTRTLAVGEHVVIDPNGVGACIRLPPAGSAGAEHLYVRLALEGREAREGVSAPCAATGSS